MSVCSDGLWRDNDRRENVPLFKIRFHFNFKLARFATQDKVFYTLKKPNLELYPKPSYDHSYGWIIYASLLVNIGPGQYHKTF